MPNNPDMKPTVASTPERGTEVSVPEHKQKDSLGPTGKICPSRKGIVAFLGGIENGVAGTPYVYCAGSGCIAQFSYPAVEE